MDKEHVINEIERRTRALSDGMKGTTSKQSCLVPCNVSGNHWIFTHIFPHDEEVCLMDPMYNGIHDADWKQVVELALKMFNSQTVGKKRKKKTTWRVIKFTKKSYTEDEINEVRMEWADCVEAFVV